MSEILQFALLGLGAGGMYALAALGLVLVYRTSGVVNFGHGAVGMAGTYLYWELTENHDWAFAPALVAGLAFCAAIGALVQIAVMRPLRNASVVVRVIATLGVLTSLQSLAGIRYPRVLAAQHVLPTDPWRFLGLTVGANRLLLFLIALAVAGGLAAVYRWTSFGVRTSAVAENPRAVMNLGHSADRIALYNWMIGSALAGLAGILLVPMTGLEATQLTLLVIPALAAAVVGRLVSFPITFAAGAAIGVLQSLSARYVDARGWSEALPFLLMVGALVFQGSRHMARGEGSLRLPKVSTAAVTPGRVLFVAIVAAWVSTLGPKWADAATVTFAVAIVLLSVVVVTGFAGQLSLAQFTLAGLGALIAGRLVADHDVPFLLAVVIAAVSGLVTGVLFGAPAMRTRGVALAVATLGMSVAAFNLVFKSSWLTGGTGGITVEAPSVFGYSLDPIRSSHRYAVAALVILVVLCLAVMNLRRGSAGRRMLAVRANERAASSLGINPAAVKMYAFALGSAIASVGGVLYAFRSPILVFDSFPPLLSVQAVGLAVIGGVGTIAGPVIGATLFAGAFGTRIGAWFGSGVERYLPLIGGLILIANLIHAPDGLAYIVAERLRAIRAALGRLLHRKRPPAVVDVAALRAQAPGAAAATVTPRTLAIDGVGVRFGGVVALDDVSFAVQPGQVVGLIGPNGAGKTTLFDAITGFVRPDQGVVHLDGADLGRTTPHRRARSGVGRSFQSLELFEDLTVLENLLVAADHGRRRSYLLDLLRPAPQEVTAGMVAAVDEFGFWDDLGRLPGELAYGRRRLVAVARAVAAEPSVLLLDEPAAGLDAADRDELARLVRHLADVRGMAVLLVEHDVELVMAVSDHVVALDFGRVIASGTPAEVRTSKRLVEAYMGTEPEPMTDAVVAP